MKPQKKNVQPNKDQQKTVRETLIQSNARIKKPTQSQMKGKEKQH